MYKQKLQKWKYVPALFIQALPDLHANIVVHDLSEPSVNAWPFSFENKKIDMQFIFELYQPNI